MKLLITGGAGYIGSALALKAATSGYDVRIMDKLGYSVPFVKAITEIPGIEYAQGHIENVYDQKKCIEGVDSIIHLAGVSDGLAGKNDPASTYQLNVSPLDRFIDLSIKSGINYFLFASTFGVYGNRYRVALQEDIPMDPSDPYSASKAIAEKIIKEAGSESFCTCSLRIAMAFGISPTTRYNFLINRLTLDALTKGNIRIMGGHQKRPQVHVQDIGNAFIKLLKSDSKNINRKSFNLVSENPSVLEIAEIIKEILPGLKIEILPARDNEDTFEMDGNRFNEVCRFKPTFSLSDGIKEIIKHYRKGNIHPYEMD